MADRIENEVPDHLDGARLDKALAEMLEVGRSEARELIERGATVDGEEARPAARVRAGAVVVSAAPRPPQVLAPEPVAFEVLYEDEALLVIDKPAGVVVHPGSGRQQGTLAAGLLHRYPELEGVGSPQRWGLVHRLDKDTSGVMLVARTPLTHAALSRQIAERQVQRSYLALVDGVPTAPTGSIEAPIGRDPDRPMRRTVIRGGKPARTHFEVERVFENYGCSLLGLRLETGRTHQIRVHLAAIDHPVIGDDVYGKTTSVVSPRIFLHASAIALTHPEHGRHLEISAPLPHDLQAVLDGLTGNKADDSIPSGQ